MNLSTELVCKSICQTVFFSSFRSSGLYLWRALLCAHCTYQNLYGKKNCNKTSYTAWDITEFDFICSMKPSEFRILLFRLITNSFGIPWIHIKYINLWDSWWLLYYWRIFGFAVDKRDKTFVSEISLIELNELNAFELRILRKSKAKSSIDNSMLYFVFSCFLSSCVPFAQLISRFVR